MKIAIFSDTYLPSVNGVAVVAAKSAEALAKRGHEIWVFTVGQKSKTEPFWQEEKIHLTILPSIPTGGVYEDTRLTLPIGIAWRRLKKFNPDIIHAHTPFSVGWEAVWVAKQLKKPLVGTHHTFYDHYLKHIKADFDWMKKLSWKYTTIYYNFCDLVLSPSRALADAMIDHGLKKTIQVLRNPIETDIFIPCKKNDKIQIAKQFGLESKKIIVYSGRVSYEKSIDQVIRAFAIVARKNPDIGLLVAGGGPDLNKLTNLAGELNIKNEIIFTGRYDRANLPRLLQAGDVFVTASKSENMPLSVLEAMACGLPIIAVKEKGLAEIVQNNVNGLFAKTDDPADMAEKSLAILADNEKLENFGAASRALSLEYGEETVLRELEEIYKKLIKRII